MTSAATRIWTFASSIFMILVVALGWFLGASPKLAEAARFDLERTSVLAQNDLARITIAQLEADSEQLEDLREQLQQLRAEFPTQAEYDAATEEFIVSLLGAGLELQSISINEPSAVSAAAAPDDEQGATESEVSGVLPPGSLLEIAVTVTVAGDLRAALSFIETLQVSPRFSIVPSGDFSQGSNLEARAMTFQLTMYAVTAASEDGANNPAGSPVSEGTSETPEPSESPEGEPTNPEPSPQPTP